MDYNDENMMDLVEEMIESMDTDSLIEIVSEQLLKDFQDSEDYFHQMAEYYGGSDE